MIKNKKIVLKKKTKIYILAPANTFTGGPECLHQFAYHVRKIFKVQTLMFYLPNESKNPIHKNFKHYNVNYTNSIEDQKDNILIMPEHFMYLKFGLKFSNIQKIIWWLSIDNYLGYKFRFENKKIIRSVLKLPFNIINLFNRLFNFYFGIYTYHDFLKTFYKFSNYKQQKEIQQASYHLMQSFYAYDYLKDKIENLYFLFDYQNKKLFKTSKEYKKKENLICYSHKSNEFIQLLKKSSKRKFIELKGLTSQQLIKTLKRTKIYIDFGYHPGKDKMPREAVLFNNCIITNRKGSAENNFDIPISKRFKFKQKYSDLNSINSTINICLNNHNKEMKKFSKYKKKVLNEEKVFKKQLLNIFCFPR